MNTIQNTIASAQIKAIEAYEAATSFMGRSVVVLYLDSLAKYCLKFSIAQKIYNLMMSIKEELSLTYSKIKRQIIPVKIPIEIAEKYLKTFKQRDRGGREYDGKSMNEEMQKLSREIIRYVGIPEINNEANMHFLMGKLLGIFSDKLADRERCAFAELYFNHFLRPEKFPDGRSIIEAEIKKEVAEFICRFKENLSVVVERAKSDRVIQKMYGIPSVNLTRCEIAKVSDSHNGSQFVCILTYGRGENSRKVCYKPRSLLPEMDYRITQEVCSLALTLSQKKKELISN